jgi:hypothetical protein
VQAASDTQETLTSELSAELGCRWTDHLCPSQRSATLAPSAIQNPCEVHDTAAKVAKRTGVVWTVQLEPSQRSARVWERPPASVYDPTAVQNVLDGHDTAKSWPLCTTGWGTA